MGFFCVFPPRMLLSNQRVPPGRKSSASFFPIIFVSSGARLNGGVINHLTRAFRERIHAAYNTSTRFVGESGAKLNTLEHAGLRTRRRQPTKWLCGCGCGRCPLSAERASIAINDVCTGQMLLAQPRSKRVLCPFESRELVPRARASSQCCRACCLYAVARSWFNESTPAARRHGHAHCSAPAC